MGDGRYTAQDAYRTWASFYRNEAIKKLGQYPAWTVTDPRDKRPLAFEGLVEGRFFGASPKDAEACVTLDALVQAIPAAVNNALRLDAQTMGYLVFDIEKTATDAIRKRLLELPWVYAETSMSGRGIHLIVPYPTDLMERYPYAAVKPVLKAADGTWEVLLSHWVTFTRNTLQATPGTRDVASVLEPLLAQARPPVAPEALDALPDIDEIPEAPFVMAYLRSERFVQPLSRYNGDESRRDFAGIIYYLKRIRSFCALNASLYALTDEAQLAIAIQMLTDDGLERDKWFDHPINGVQWIVYTGQKALATLKADAQKGTSGRRKGRRS